MPSKPPQKSSHRVTVLDEFQLLAYRVILAAGVAPDQADRLAVALVVQMSQHFGGAAVYWPRGRTSGDRQALIAFGMWQDGKSVHEIAHDLGVSTRWVYSLIVRARSRLSAAEVDGLQAAAVRDAPELTEGEPP